MNFIQANISEEKLSGMDVPSPALRRNIEAILFDDDKFYCMLFKQNANQCLLCDFATTEDTFFKKLGKHHYDFAIVDYDLHSTNALHIANRMHDNFDLPLVVISSSLNNLYNCQKLVDDKLDNIVGVISKWEDPKFIVEKAMEIVAKHEPLSFRFNS